MQLGKLLDETDITARIQLLVGGAVFYSTNGTKLWFDHKHYTLMHGHVSFMHAVRRSVLGDWYHPLPTYEINGVELVDERVKEMRPPCADQVYLSSTWIEQGYATLRANAFGYEWGTLLSNGVVHRTKEAAIAHTKAMLIVKEKGQSNV